MARVAICPQCRLEILILDDSNQDAWAKCPECRAFFQISQAAAREIQPVIPIEEESVERSSETVIMDETVLDSPADKAELTLSRASDATISEFSDELADDEHRVAETELEIGSRDEPTVEIIAPLGETPVSDEPATTIRDSIGLPISGTDSPIEETESAVGALISEPPASATPEERLQESTNRIDKWFRTTKSQVEVPPASVGDELETADSADIQIEQPSDSPDNQPTWNDPDHIERLLADVESANTSNIADEDQFAVTDKAAHSHDEPVQVGPIGQRAAEPPQFFIPPGRIPRRTKSLLRTLTATVLSGIVGLALGYYALLWILGPTGDFMKLAQHLPVAVLPADFQSELTTRPIEDRPEEPMNETFAAAMEEEESDAPGTAEQASYTAAPDDRYGVVPDSTAAGDQSPLPFEGTTAAPLTQASGIDMAEIANAPSFSPDELAVALQAAQEAQPKLVEGNLQDSHEVRRAKGFGYLALCDLAQKMAFVDKSTRADYANALDADAERLFRQTLADTHTRSEVGRILHKWMGSPNRKHGGVFFAGGSLRCAEKGTVEECQFDVGSDETVIVLLSPADAEQLANSSKPVGIVGWIVDSPAKIVNGYTGDAPRAIWASRLLLLE